MQHERSLPTSLGKKLQYFLILCVATILCFSQFAAAQSGRRTNKGSSTPAPPVVNDTTVNISNAKTASTISSIEVVGDSKDISYLYSSSNYLDLALKDCVTIFKDSMRYSGSGFNVAKGGKAKLEQAIERAKNETDTHILWLNLVMKDDGYGNTLIDHIDYAVIEPKTARRMTYGQVNPSKITVIGQGGGGVLRIPTVPTARTSPGAYRSQIRTGVREIVDRLLRWDWL